MAKMMNVVVVLGQGLGVLGRCGRCALAPCDSQVRKTAMLVVYPARSCEICAAHSERLRVVSTPFASSQNDWVVFRK